MLQYEKTNFIWQIGFFNQGCFIFVVFHRPVTNFDEIPFHFINCIHNHLCTKVKVHNLCFIRLFSVILLNDDN
jgi:hypothetical protein